MSRRPVEQKGSKKVSVNAGAAEDTNIASWQSRDTYLDRSGKGLAVDDAAWVDDRSDRDG